MLFRVMISSWCTIVSPWLSHRSRQNPTSVMVLFSVTPQLHLLVGQNSAMNMLAAPLSERTMPYLFIGLLYRNIPSLSANALVYCKVKMLRVNP